MPLQTQPFGRRNLRTSPESARARAPLTHVAQQTIGAEQSEQSVPDGAVLAFAAELAEARKNNSENIAETGPRIVSNSKRAVTLAGLVAACLYVSLDLASILAFGQQISTTYNNYHVPTTALLISGSIWLGARASFISLMFVRMIMSRLETTEPAAYAVCGGLVSLAYSLIFRDEGPMHVEALVLDMATGIAAGFFYRIFAGTKPKPV